MILTIRAGRSGASGRRTVLLARLLGAPTVPGMLNPTQLTLITITAVALSALAGATLDAMSVLGALAISIPLALATGTLTAAALNR